MLEVKSENINYLAKVVKLTNLRPHPGADRLQLTTIENQVVVTGLNSKIGEVVLYFPLESAINQEFLSFTSNFANAELNKDKTKKSFFRDNGRVRATKLRGVVSEGYIHPISDFNFWLKEKGIRYEVTDQDIGREFDTVGGVTFVEKYVNKQHLIDADKERRRQTGGGKVKKENRIIDNQYRQSPEYRQLKREINTINPEDWIEITSKWHGAFGMISKVLTKRKLSFVDRISKFFGAKIKEEEYNLIYASRRCLKSEEFRDTPAQNYYNCNIWQIIADKYKNCLQDGLVISGELIGYTPNGAPIQKGKQGAYDYGCEVGQCDFIVFRIYYVSPSGNTYEFSLQQVIDYCQKYGLKHVPVYYIGKAKDKYPELGPEHWHENFLEKLKNEYLEKDDIYCKTSGLADEGVVLSKRVGGFEGFKLKSQKFVLGESEQLDSNEENIEDAA